MKSRWFSRSYDSLCSSIFLLEQPRIDVHVPQDPFDVQGSPGMYLIQVNLKKRKNWRTLVLFVGPLISLFWTFGDVFCGF